jgi:acetyl esterase/lipase
MWKTVLLMMAVACAGVADRAAGQAGAAPATNAIGWAETVGNHYLIFPDITYGVANSAVLKLDVWQRKDATSSVPTLIYFHGGGWIFGDRTGATPLLLPYLQMGWNVINVEYRMASTSVAPAAVEDTRCALRWAVRNAKQYNIDTNRIVLTGHSAGGHLALITGMLPEDTGLDNACPGTEPMKVAAIINWYGIADVEDLLHGENYRNYAVMWMGSQTDAAAIAKRVSPLTYVRPGLPPILTIHGDADPVVPYDHARRLHAALTKAGVPNELFTIKSGGHGQFSDKETLDAFDHVHAFLRANGLER